MPRHPAAAADCAPFRRQHLSKKTKAHNLGVPIQEGTPKIGRITLNSPFKQPQKGQPPKTTHVEPGQINPSDQHPRGD